MNMENHFIHALVLTQFESSLIPLQWEDVVAADFTVHLLYCKTSGRTILLSNNQQFADGR